MSNICISCSEPENWKPLLAQPEKQWRTGFSAKTLAYSWSDANGFPAEVGDVLKSSPHFRDVELLLAIPEHQVALPGGMSSSQSDIWVLARTGSGLASIAVEGKVRESFDKLVREWRADASSGKDQRLEFLANTLHLPVSELDDIRYQLLHRTASALIEAKRFCAAHAVMLVNSFSQTQEHFDDFAQFVALFGREAVPETVVTVEPRSGIALHFAWVTGDKRFLLK